MSLYDPNEFPKAHFTLGEVLAWARTKPAGETYDYRDHYNCGVAQYLRASGLAEFPRIAWNTWRDGPGDIHSFDERVKLAAEAAPHSFGAFADRLEQVSA